MKFKPRSLDTRKFIIESTASLFNTKGYAGTSMSDITDATQLTKGSIYGNFENKEEVALAVFDYNLGIINSLMLEKVSLAKNNKDKLIAYLDVYTSADYKELFKCGGCPLLNTGIEADDTNEALRKKVEKALFGWKDRMAALITAGIEAKEFKNSIDAGQMALSIIALLEGGVFIAKASKNLTHLHTVVNTAKYLIEKMEKKKN